MQQPTGSIWKRSRSRRLRSAAPAHFAAAVAEDSGANAEREEAEWRARNVLAIEDDRALARRLEDQGCVVAEAGRDGSTRPSCTLRAPRWLNDVEIVLPVQNTSTR